jgi:hypothetical protein
MTYFSMGPVPRVTGRLQGCDPLLEVKIPVLCCGNSAVVLTMRGLNIFSIFVVGLVTQTLPPVPVSLAEISSTAADIRIQYTIGYHLAKPASQGGYRAVHVDACVNGNDRLVVKTRSGYFAKR